jgi:D-alanyl-D-alanine carboxypeptidase
MIADNEAPEAAAPQSHSAPAHPLQLAAVKTQGRPAAGEIGEGDNTNEEDDAPALRSAAALHAAPVAAIAPSAPAPTPRVRTADANPQALGWVRGPDAAPVAARIEAARAPRPREEALKSEVRAEETRVAKSDDSHDGAKGGWAIQIGASDDAGKANELLIRARERNRGALASAKAVTEKVKKGEDVFYRARFAGLDSTSAEQACRSLKRTGFSCFAAPD